MAAHICLDHRYATTRMVIPELPAVVGESSRSEGVRSVGGLRPQGYCKCSTENEPLISIVTVVKNGVKHFEQSLLSVVNQTYNNLEYIVIDGCSDDGTLDLLKKYDHCVDYWVSERDDGIYHAINKGISLASGKYIAVLQSDDWYDAGLVEAVSEAIVQHGQQTQSVIFSNYTVVNETYSILRKFKSTLAYWKCMSISHQAMFISADVYKVFGLYDTHYKLAADYDFFLKMITGGVSFFQIEHYGVFFRLGGLSSKSNSISIAEATRINRKYLGRFSKKHLSFLAHIYRHVLSDVIEGFFFRLFGEDRVLNIRKRIKKLRNYDR